MSLKSFKTAIIFFFSLYLLFSFFYLYNKQKDFITKELIRDVKSIMFEVRYLISRDLSERGLEFSKTLLDRILASEEYISSISISKDDKIIISSNRKLHNKFIDNRVNIKEISVKHINDRVYYYVNIEDLKYNYQLLIKIDTSYIIKRLNSQIRDSIEIYIIPIFIMIFIWILINIVITNPIKDLSEFVRGRKLNLNKFYIKDIESLKKSITKSFQKRDKVEKELREYKDNLEEIVEVRTKELENIKFSLEKAQEIAHVGNWDWDIEKNSISWSDEIYRIFGFIPQEFTPTYEAFLNTIHPEDIDLVTNGVNDALNDDIDYDVYHRIVLADGSEKIVHEKGDITRDKDGNPLHMLGTVQDVTELKKIQKVLEKTNQDFMRYIKIIDEHVITSSTDLNGKITYVSKAFSEVSGYTKNELLGKKDNILRHPDIAKDIESEVWTTVLIGKTWQGEIKNLKKDGSSYWVYAYISPMYDDSDNIIGYTAIRHDITDKKRIEELSITDELTKLYNRRYFNQIFEKEFNRAKRDKKIIAFLILDVDNFKKYNDTYGHQSGDEVLMIVGKVLRDSFQRSSDFTFRLGGEEFGVLMSVNSEEDVETLAENLRFSLENQKIEHSKNPPANVITASIGLKIVNFEKDNNLNIETIYKLADEALYLAKESGRNQIKIDNK